MKRSRRIAYRRKVWFWKEERKSRDFKIPSEQR